jgi:2-dehydro-3-deoxyphosphogluconate aldolase/(4S)-4-hydroxy-2-oxoglutarate aldolase
VQETGFAARVDAVAAAIADAVVLPVVRADTPDAALKTCDWAIAQALPAVELTTTIPDWRAALAEARRRHPRAALGMGTLTEAADARDACALGADFLVSPVPAPAVARVAAEHGVLMVGGGFSPGELLAGGRDGLAKLFPAHAAGTGLLRSVLAIAPGLRVVPTGGIGLDEVEDWLDAGAFAVGVGSELRPSPEAAARLRALRARHAGAAA